MKPDKYMVPSSNIHIYIYIYIFEMRGRKNSMDKVALVFNCPSPKNAAHVCHGRGLSMYITLYMQNIHI